MRYLQSTYWLEPAGSHGVWGLDDYHFLPFYWGSGQLKGHKYIKPRAIHDPEVVEEYSKDYMYFACIQFINSVSSVDPKKFLLLSVLLNCLVDQDSLAEMAQSDAGRHLCSEDLG